MRVRVLEATAPREIETRSGRRTISEAVVGDATGRVQLTLWGRKAGTLSPGDAVEIINAWTTSYRGRVVLNAGAQSTIRRIPDEEVPQAEEIPDKFPEAPRRGAGRGRGRPRWTPRSGRGRRP